VDRVARAKEIAEGLLINRIRMLTRYWANSLDLWRGLLAPAVF